MVTRAQPLPLINKGVTPKKTPVTSTVASTRCVLIFLSFFASTSMLLTFSRPTFQGTGCLNTALSPTCRWNPRPTGISIGTCNIQYGRGCVLAQYTQEVERGGLDIISLSETTKMEDCSKNFQGYDMMCAAAGPSRSVVS